MGRFPCIGGQPEARVEGDGGLDFWALSKFITRSSRRKPGPSPFASHVRRMTIGLYLRQLAPKELGPGFRRDERM